MQLSELPLVTFDGDPPLASAEAIVIYDFVTDTPAGAVVSVEA